MPPSGFFVEEAMKNRKALAAAEKKPGMIRAWLAGSGA